jgi:hypothetical protein
MARSKVGKFIGFLVAVAPLAYSAYRFLKDNGYLDKAQETAAPYVDAAVDKANEYYEVVKDKATEVYGGASVVAQEEVEAVQDAVEEPISKPSDSI